MKRLILFFLFVTIISCSCSSDDEDKAALPKWLWDKIEQMNNNSMPGMAVYEYKWKGSYYYNIVNPVSSCLFCDFYDYDGVKYQWTSEDIDDFNKNAELIREVWNKGY